MGLMSPQISTKRLVPVCRQLATSHDAGISIVQSMQTIAEQSKGQKIGRVFDEIARDLKSGSTVAEATNKQEKYLSPLFANLLRAGEVGGNMDVMLFDLADYYEDKLKMQRQFTNQMFLPAIEALVAWFLVTFAWGMLNVALGAMETGQGGGVNGIFSYFNSYLVFQAEALFWAAIALAIGIVLSRAGVLGWITGAVSTHIWPLSSITRELGLARFFRSMSLLLTSGVPISRCIENSAAATGNPYMERDLLQTIGRVREGGTLSEAFAATRYLTPLSRDMLSVGEVSGKLEEQLKKVSEYHFDQGSTAMERATKVFTMTLMLCIFGIIGFCIISFYAKLYGGMMDGLGI